MTTPAFEYHSSLPSGEIRLVKLIPSAHVGGTIHFTLQHHILQIHSLYWTLSYAWGDPHNTRIAYCDGKPFSITKSLYEALEQLIALELFVPIWIDAICINQTDLDEKAQQIRMMQEIYRRSSRTIIWLGTSSSDDEMAMRLMRGLEAAHSDAFSESSEEAHSDSSASLPAFRPPLKDASYLDRLPSVDAADWRALRNFFSRPWFSRIWVIQELCAGQNCAMLCGHTFISHDLVLKTAYRWMHDINISAKARYFSRSYSHPAGVSTANALEFLKRQSQSTRSFELLSLLHISVDFEFTVPHDRIFALLGLTSGIDGSIVNYRTSYRELLEHVILQLRNQSFDMQKSPFEVLRHCPQRRSRPDGYPSWLPIWRNTLQLKNNITSVMFPTTYYNVRSEFEIEAHQYLRLRGKLFDVIETSILGPGLADMRNEFAQHIEIAGILNDALEFTEHRFVKAIEELQIRHQDPDVIESARYQDRLIRALCIGLTEVNPQRYITDRPPGRFDARDLWGNYRDFILTREIVNQKARNRQWRVTRYIYVNHHAIYHILQAIGEKRYSWLSISRSMFAVIAFFGYLKGTAQVMTYLILIVQAFACVTLVMKYIRTRRPPDSLKGVEPAEQVMNRARHDYDLFHKAYTPWWQDKSFFVTAGGRFGWANLDIQQGDRLCVFEGHRAPFVLRHLGESADQHGQETSPTAYEQFGEAFVSETMDFEVHRIPQLQWQTIRLG